MDTLEEIEGRIPYRISGEILRTEELKTIEAVIKYRMKIGTETDA